MLNEKVFDSFLKKLVVNHAVDASKLKCSKMTAT